MWPENDGVASVHIWFCWYFLMWPQITSSHNTHCHNRAEVCFSHCFVRFLLILFFFFVCLFAFFLSSHSHLYGINRVSAYKQQKQSCFFRTAKSILCKMTSLIAHKHTHTHMHEIEMAKEEKKEKEICKQQQQQRWFRHESGMTWMKSSHIYTHTSHHIT